MLSLLFYALDTGHCQIMKTPGFLNLQTTEGSLEYK